ncbi:MAG: TspO/MBR family protein [Caldimonas sp.]
MTSEPAPPTETSQPMPPAVAALAASSAFLVPMLLSRSSSPTPDHPRTLLWYKALRQPSFKPPDIVIPLAWTVIESALAVAAYRLLRQPSAPRRNTALGWLALNIASIGGWSRLFFGRRDLPMSTVAAAAMVGSAAVYVAQAKKTDRVSAAAGVPLVAWLAFATVLTAAIWRRNR